MRLLLFTQKVDKNDAYLGFFHRWLIEFAKHVDSLIVVCLYKGEYDLPENVEVYSLGKEKGVSRIGRLINFYRYLFRFSPKCDAVFIHMNPIYGVLGGLFWRLSGVYVMLWYVHREVNLTLRIATFFSNIVFTASEYSFRLHSRKRRIVGHGIDVRQFQCPDRSLSNTLRLIVVGRITRIKNCIELIYLLDILKGAAGKPVTLKFVGDTVSHDDRAYLHEMKKLAHSLGLDDDVVFAGSVPYDQLLPFYCSADVALNLSPDGGIDKAVLEAMASETPVIVRNEAFRKHFGPYADDLIWGGKDHNILAEKVLAVSGRHDKKEMLRHLQQVVYDNFDVEGLIRKMIDTYESR